MTENQSSRARGEAADEAAEERTRPTRNPPAEGSLEPADGSASDAAGNPGDAPLRELHLSPEDTARVEEAAPAALRGHEEDANPAGPPP